MANQKRERHITPAGIAIYPRLTAPDFKYKKDYGEYSVKLKLTAAEAEPMIKLITEATEKAYKAKCAELEKPKIKRSPNVPFKEELDDQEKPTGNFIFHFKLPGGGKKKETGEVYKLSVQCFDKTGALLKDDIWGGSTIKVAYELRPYYTEGLGHGMTLRIGAVQVVKLVTRGMGDAGSYGFEVEEPDEAETETDAEDSTLREAQRKDTEAGDGKKPNAASF